MRKLILVSLASATFGGTIAALATAAIQSQATPEAIAAAVQRVSDSNAQASLRAINAKLSPLSSLNANLGKMDYTLWAICRDTPGEDQNFCGPLIAGAP